MYGLTLSPLLIRIGAFALWTALVFASGYAYKAHRVQVEQAATKATQEAVSVTADASAKASDTIALQALKSQLDASATLTTRLLGQIKALQNANPAPAVSCRIPDGLREQVNADLAATRTR